MQQSSVPVLASLIAPSRSKRMSAWNLPSMVERINAVAPGCTAVTGLWEVAGGDSRQNDRNPPFAFETEERVDDLRAAPMVSACVVASRVIGAAGPSLRLVMRQIHRSA